MSNLQSVIVTLSVSYAVIGALLLLVLALYLRFWWLRRKWAHQAGQDGARPDKPGPVTLEGEYTVHRDSDARRED